MTTPDIDLQLIAIADELADNREFALEIFVVLLTLFDSPADDATKWAVFADYWQKAAAQ